MSKLGDITQGNKVGYADCRKYIWSACSVCGKERWVALVKGKPRYIKCKSCSKMGRVVKSGKDNPRWKGGKSKCGNYITIWQLNGKRRIREHRLVMEKFLGRKLTHNETVHHMNKDRSDNRIENLMLFKNNNEHLALHRKSGDLKRLSKFDRKKYQVQYYKNNIEKSKKYSEEYYKNNIEKLKKYKKLWYVNKHKKEKT